MERRWHVALAWAMAGDMALLAPWLLGGRSSWAFPVLGTMAWAATALALVSVLLQWQEYHPFAVYDAACGRADQHPLRRFGWGCAWSLPLWLFIGILAISASNPAYIRDAGGALVMQDFNAALPLVIDPSRSGPGIYFLAGLLALLSLLSNPVLRPHPRWIRFGLTVALVNATVLTWVGFWFRFTGAEALLGRFEPQASYFFATFYYKNHWAAYAILHCGIAGWFFFRDLPRWQADARRSDAGGLALAALLFLGLSLAVVDSRSGILLFGLFCTGFLVKLCRMLHSGTGRRVLALLTVVGLGGFGYLGYTDLEHNLQCTGQRIDPAGLPVFDDIRAVHAAEVCLAMFRVRPVWGWGYLSYDPLFPVYATDYFRDAEGTLGTDMEFAHNDWLQHLAEFGVVGVFLLLLGLFPFARGLIRPDSPGTGLLLLGLMALWDFPFSNPAVLASAVLLLLCVHMGDSRQELRIEPVY